MQVSEQFARFVRRVIAAFVLVGLGFLVSDTVSPRHEVSAQTAGTIGIQAQQLPVFSAASTTQHSAIFNDIGQGLSILFYCNTSFTGVIDLEWSPTGVAPFYVLTQGSYPSGVPDSSCHTLQLGGYFPNMRASVTPIAGSLSAWYTASSGPIPTVSSGLGTNGPSSPINCDHAINVGLATANFSSLGITPFLTGDTIVLCNFSVSFNGTTSAGTVQLGWADTAAHCVSAFGNVTWAAYTTSATPQTYNISTQQRAQSNFATPVPCLQNSSGATVNFSFSYASVHGL